jgi:hypothetical protein
MRTRAALTVAGWLAGATAAVVGVTAAMSILGHALLSNSDPTYTAAQVQQKLARAGQAPARAAAAPTAPGATATWPTARRFQGGIVSAECASGQAELSSWSAAQGFQVAGVSAGPATAASIRFASAASDELVTATCAGGMPRFTSTAEPAGAGTADAGGAAGSGGAAGAGAAPGAGAAAGAGGAAGDAGGGQDRGGSGRGGTGRGGGPGAGSEVSPGRGPGSDG